LIEKLYDIDHLKIMNKTWRMTRLNWMWYLDSNH